MKKLLVVSFVILIVFQVRAQGLAQSNSYLSAIATITDADIINAATLVDPLQEKVKEFAPSVFSLNMTALRGETLAVNMEVFAEITLEEDRQPVVLVQSRTKNPFLVIRSRMFTSKDAQEGSSKDISFNNTIDEDFRKKLKDKITNPASGGKVPSGTYYVKITLSVVSVNGNVPDPPAPPIYLDYTFNVTNPTTAVLDVPFTNGYIYPTPFPQFQWTYDTRGVLLSVYEKRPEHQSLEDAISASDPYLQVEILRKESGNLTTFTYPQTATSRPGVRFIRGPRQLERGKMYVVVLDGIRTAFGFEVDPLRTIRSFVIADPQGQVVINVLQTALSSGVGGQFQGIFNSIQDQNLLINTNGIMLNGVKITPQDLQRLLTENKDRITSVRFEE